MLRSEEIAGRADAGLTALKALDGRLTTALDGAATSETLRSALLAASYFGVPGSVPNSAVGDSAGDRELLRAQAGVAQSEVRRRIGEAPAAPAPGASAEEIRDAALARLRAVFGPDFQALPELSPVGGAGFDPVFPFSDALQGGDPLAATQWFQRLTRVREGAHRLGEALTLGEALGYRDLLRFHVAQLPATPGDRWAALPFAADGEPPAGRLSIVAHLPAGRPAAGQPLCGLLFDEVSEVLPSRERTTGVAFHFDQPNASAPQAILVAVPPATDTPWTLEMLREAVLEALDLAKLRMVDLDALKDAGQFLPATYLALNSKGATVATDLVGGAGQPLGTADG